jgi:hypothetical protein
MRIGREDMSRKKERGLSAQELQQGSFLTNVIHFVVSWKYAKKLLRPHISRSEVIFFHVYRCAHFPPALGADIVL